MDLKKNKFDVCLPPAWCCQLAQFCIACARCSFKFRTSCATAFNIAEHTQREVFQFVFFHFNDILLICCRLTLFIMFFRVFFICPLFVYTIHIYCIHFFKRVPRYLIKSMKYELRCFVFSCCFFFFFLFVRPMEKWSCATADGNIEIIDG